MNITKDSPSEAYERGWNAAQEGKSLADNPYIDADGWPLAGCNQKQGESWEEGYADQRRGEDGE
jgi:hypothetical protein